MGIRFVVTGLMAEKLHQQTCELNIIVVGHSKFELFCINNSESILLNSQKLGDGTSCRLCLTILLRVSSIAFCCICHFNGLVHDCKCFARVLIRSLSQRVAGTLQTKSFEGSIISKTSEAFPACMARTASTNDKKKDQTPFPAIGVSVCQFSSVSLF
jgi:hypothetical protein